MFRIVVLFAVCCLVTPAATPAVGQADPAALYAECLDLARTDPNAAIAQAQTWGGDAASHCQGVALMTLGRYEEAAARFRFIARADGDDRLRADALAQAGQALLLDNQPEEAEAVLRQAIQLKPGDAGLRIDRAVARAEQFKFAAAVKDLDQALLLDPANVDALVFRATALRKLDKLPRALVDIEAALARAPRHGEALFERGNLRRLTGDRYGARADWQALIVAWPDSPAAAAAAENIRRLDNPPELAPPELPQQQPDDDG